MLNQRHFCSDFALISALFLLSEAERATYFLFLKTNLV